MVTLLLLLWGCPADESGAPRDTDSGEPPTDADGDGYDVSEDCDDRSAYVYPGAKEYCDAVDQDCDGDPLAEGVCGEPAFLDAAFVPLNVTEDGMIGVGVVRDLTGNGVADFLGQGLGPAGRIYDGTQLGADEAVASVEFGPDSVFVSSFLDPGDVTGDGLNDVVMVEQYAQKLYVFHAPLDRTESFLSADAEWSIGSGFTDFCTTIRELGDVDRDGRADLGCNVTGPESSTTWLMFGTEGWEVSAAALMRGSADLANLGDLDGDGLSDVLSLSSYGAVVFGGADLAPAVALAEEANIGEWALMAGTAFTVGDDLCGSLGDQDADGYSEFFIGVPGLDPSGAMYFFDGPVSEIDEMDDAVGVLLGAQDDEHQYGGLGEAQVLRRDGDDLAAAILTVDYETAQRVLIPAAPPSGVVEITDWPQVLFDTTWDHGPNTEAWRAGVDVTGDGVGEFSAGKEDTNQHGIIAGFVPPWDDPYYW